MENEDKNPSKDRPLPVVLHGLTFIPLPEQDVGDRMRSFTIIDEDDTILGSLTVNYRHADKTCSIANVRILEASRGKGYGVRIYNAIADLPMPGGQTPRETGASFESSASHTLQAERVWESLARRGLAQVIGGGVTSGTSSYRYVYNVQQTVPGDSSGQAAEKKITLS
jgi:hypothetical protein